MAQAPNDATNTSRRSAIASGVALLGSTILTNMPAKGQSGTAPASTPQAAASALPAGYNILFVLVDQEHFFEKWPFPVPGREAIKKAGTSFLNHQAAACVCSAARSVIYTGQHIQHTGVADNPPNVWQKDLPPTIATIGHRLTELGYHASYQGKWHMSVNLDQTQNPIDAPMKDYRKIIESYGFKDFFGIGDLIDGTQGGYAYDDTTLAATLTWLRKDAQELRKKAQPWYLAVNLVNPHDTMYFNSDLADESVQGRQHAFAIARAPEDDIYRARWDVPLPVSRSQPLDQAGRPLAHRIYQAVTNLQVGTWPDEDRRWRALQDYYFNAIRDCDRKVEVLLEALKGNGMADNTIVIFTADHGELGGHHQLRNKGATVYRQQNHVPLMIVHPAFAGGKQCQAMTSQLDLVPTIIGLTGVEEKARKSAAAGLNGRDFSVILRNPETAPINAIRPATLFNFDMLSFQDARWASMTIDTKPFKGLNRAGQITELNRHPPDFHNRMSIRSIFDGRYRFARYFAPVAFNTPETMEQLFAMNDIEIYDHRNDPAEMDNLALDPKRNGELIAALNQETNRRIAEEVGIDDGRFLPIRDGKWHFPPADER